MTYSLRLYALANSYTNEAAPNTTYSSEDMVKLSDNSAGSAKRGYFDFYMPDIGNDFAVISADFYGYVVYATNTPSADAYTAADTVAVGGVTWNNQPSTDVQMGNRAPAYYGYAKWSVGNVIPTSQGSFQFILKTPESASPSEDLNLHSREASDWVALVLHTVTGSFGVGETVTGGSSSATGDVIASFTYSGDTVVWLDTLTGQPFTPGEVVTSSGTGQGTIYDGTLGSNNSDGISDEPYLDVVLRVVPNEMAAFAGSDAGNSLTDTANTTLNFTWTPPSGAARKYIENVNILYDTDPDDLIGSTPETSSTMLNGSDIEPLDGTYSGTLAVPASDTTYHFRIMSENVDYTADSGVGGGIVPITVYAKPTTPALTVDDNTVKVGEPVTFTLTEDAADTGKVEYYIDFDDGTNSGWVSGGTIRHYYTADGTYDPTGYVRWNTAQDKTQMISTGDALPSSITVSVGDIVAKLDVTTSAYIDDTIILNGTGSYTKQGYITKYEFDLDGDSVYEVDNGTDPIRTTSFATSGNKTVGLRVTSSATGTPTDTATATVTIGQCTVYDLQLNVTSCSDYAESAPRTVAQTTRYSEAPVVDDGGKTYPIWRLEYNNVSNSDATNDIAIFEHFRDEDELEFVKFKYDGTNYVEGHVIDIESERVGGGAWRYTVIFMERAPPTEHTDTNYSA